MTYGSTHSHSPDLLPVDRIGAIEDCVRKAETAAVRFLTDMECPYLHMSMATKAGGPCLSLTYWAHTTETTLEVRFDLAFRIPEELYTEWYGSGQRHVTVAFDSDHFDKVVFIQYQKKEDT